jgi:glycosyltransferase involved in cell wall biosynthesis
MMADGAGSGAGTFPVLLAGMLERGHHVDMFGSRGFNEPKSLERFPNYRFIPVRLPRIEWLWWRAAALKTPYPLSFVSQLSQLGYQRETIRAVAARPGHYDVLFFTDAFAMWPASLPVISWPQSPPQSEAAALRSRQTREWFVSVHGHAHYAALQGFYAYRWLCARASLRNSDIYLCGSRWARDDWRRFGADEHRLRTASYLVDVVAFADVPPLGTRRGPITLLWLGRATARKRLDLFLAAFVELRRRRPEVRARLVGNLRADQYAARLLEPHIGDPSISIEDPVPRARVPELFAEVDVLVQPSEKENFGFSIAEALAAGRPVVLGPTNGTLDYVGEAGFAFGAYDASSVADAAERAMDAVVGNGAELSSKARSAALEHFTPRFVVDRFEQICRALASERAR